MAEVIPGADAWSADGGDAGVLMLHGFTGNPVSLRPLAESLAEAGFSVELPRLPGHGTTWQELQRTTWQDWAREASAAFHRLRARTRVQVVFGLSMGGALALHLAVARGDDLAGAVLVNPFVFSADPKLAAVPLLKWVVPGTPGVGNDIAKPGGDEKPYPKIPLKALASLLKMQAGLRARLHEVTIPLLVMTSRDDHVVDPGNSRIVLEGVSSTDVTQLWLERSYHVATLDYDAEVIEQQTPAFVSRVTGVEART